MTSVLALIEGAKEENLEPNQTMLLKDIERYIHDLSYAENFIQLAKLENIQTLNIERCDVHSLIYNAVIQIYPSAKLRDITIHYPETNPELWILCDSSLMERAIVNILDNAVKYSDEDTQIDVDTSVINSVVEYKLAIKGVVFQKLIYTNYLIALSKVVIL
ncbi:sensor histidine kinase [Actinoplanes utahensis]|uniref:sensor histidine kinase n=1 Tax=Actinoplanes utahensis TaxID=1869 RepID=UPI0036219AA6